MEQPAKLPSDAAFGIVDPQRGPYDKISFKRLSQQDEEFKKILIKSSGHLDFQDPEACKALTKAILKIDFGLEVDLPDNRLYPPVPNRWNYVCWIQALVDSTAPDYSGKYDPTRSVVGLDIGTGASAIYTLLALRSRPNWTMCVTDIDKSSFNSAARNLALNNMLARTRMLQTMESGDLIPLKYLGVEKLDFTICNPPFFNNEEEMRASLRGDGKSLKPNAVCTGSENEMVCEGGDLGFVTKIINESLILREKVTWYSSMLGKQTSAIAAVKLLKEHGVYNWATGCVDPGGATKRWLLAWSFGDIRPPNDIARHGREETIPQECRPFPVQYKVPLSEELELSEALKSINSHLSGLDLCWNWQPDVGMGIGETTENVWNRAYRREQQRKKKAGERTMEEDDIDKRKVTLAFRIQGSEKPSKTIVMDWLRGTDVPLWESFCGMIHRNLRSKT